jgi:ribosome-binding protein aMBF1 (putative translation factor)
MAIERIVLEFSADTTKLQPAIDQLESLGEIDKKSADSFRKTNAEIATRTKTLQTLSTEQGKVTQSTQQIATGYEKLSQSLSKTTDKILDGASGEMVEQFALGISDALNEAGISAEQFSDKMQEAFQKGSSGNDNGASAIEKV